MFEMMLDHLREGVVETLSIVEFNIDENSRQLFMRRATSEDDRQETRQDPAMMGVGLQRRSVGYEMDRGKESNVQPFPQKVAFDKHDPKTWGKVPRNTPCPCDSGKKYKHCHGKIT